MGGCRTPALVLKSPLQVLRGYPEHHVIFLFDPSMSSPTLDLYSPLELQWEYQNLKYSLMKS